MLRIPAHDTKLRREGKQATPRKTNIGFNMVLTDSVYTVDPKNGDKCKVLQGGPKSQRHQYKLVNIWVGRTTCEKRSRCLCGLQVEQNQPAV